MDTVPDGNIISLRSGNLDRADVRARAAVRDLMLEADDVLAAVLDGDVDSVFLLHRIVNRAVGIVLDNRLATPWNWQAKA